MTKSKKPRNGKRKNQAKSTTDNNVVDIFTKEVVTVKKVKKGQRNTQLFRGIFEELLKQEGRVLQDCLVMFTTIKDGEVYYGVYEPEKLEIDAQTMVMFQNYFNNWITDRVWGSEEEDEEDDE